MLDGRVLGTWLTQMSLRQFLVDRYGAAPHAQRGTAIQAAELLDWAAIDRVLASPADVDVLVVAFGRLLDEPRPRSLADLRALMGRAIGVCARRAERGDVGLADLARRLGRDVGGVASVQLFVTPGGTHGFGWHYDDEHVFVVQTAGVKSYFLRPNTIAHDVPAAEARGFGAIAGETSRVHEATLRPGDWLYIPSRWWHVAICEEDSLSISVGVTMD